VELHEVRLVDGEMVEEKTWQNCAEWWNQTATEHLVGTGLEDAQRAELEDMEESE